MTYLDLNNLDHDPDLAQALGNMVIAWAHAETVLVHTLSMVSGMHYNSAAPAYFNIPTFQSRTKVIKALVEAWTVNDKLKKDIIKVIDKMSNLSLTRNAWVHGTWTVEKKTDKTVIFNMRLPGSKPRGKPVKAHDINEHIRAIQKWTLNLQPLVPVKISLRPSP